MKAIDTFETFLNKLDNLRLEKLDSEGNKIEFTFNVNEGATKKEIEIVERELGVKLPNSYQEFLLKYNGAKLFDFDGLDGFWILGTKDIIKANNFAKATFEEDWKSDIIIFTKYIGETNYLAFKISNHLKEYQIVDCYFQELPEEWKLIEENFNDFLNLLIEQSGSKYWLK